MEFLYILGFLVITIAIIWWMKNMNDNDDDDYGTAW